MKPATALQNITVHVDGAQVKVPKGITVRGALEFAGFTFGSFPGEGDVFAPCGVGGCYSCSVLANGEVVRSCVTKVEDGMVVHTKLPEDITPMRIVHGPEPHTVGGKATPWRLKSDGRYIEVAIWTAGCNLSCPQCQNQSITYDGYSLPMNPEDAAKLITRERHRYDVDRMAVSGGEPTLNRPWLIRYFKELRRLNPDEEAHLHLDSNGTILSKDYIDELIEEASVTDIGIEPKGISADTFMRITGVEDRSLAERYLGRAWNAVRHIIENYRGMVFLGVGLPYNKALISLEEVEGFGERLASMDPTVQLCVLDYFPTFRRMDLRRPSPEEMFRVKRLLERTGLEAVVVQTSIGHFGPRQK